MFTPFFGVYIYLLNKLKSRTFSPTARLQLRIDCDVTGPVIQGGATGMLVTSQEPQAVAQGATAVPITSNQPYTVVTTGAKEKATGELAPHGPQRVVRNTPSSVVQWLKNKIKRKPIAQPQTRITTGAQEEATGALAPQDSQAVQGVAVVPVTSRQPQAAVATTGSGRVNVGNGDLPSAQQVLNLVAFKYFQVNNPSTREELNGFIEYMEAVRKVIIVDAHIGSLIITVECGSVQILDELWKDYCTGHLNEIAQKFLVTEDLLKELGLIVVTLTMTIAREEYSACREYLLKHLGGYGNLHFHTN